MRRVSLSVPLACLACLLIGCKSRSAEPVTVAVSNSMLECAARDLLGDSTPVMRLAEPGMCPGHFDLRPSQVTDLCRCRVLLRLDFQKSLDSKLAGAVEQGLRIVEVRISGGLCEPGSYLSACRQTADGLAAAGLLDRSTADERVAGIEARVNRCAAKCHQRMAPLKGLAVLASGHQADFCRWLGLNVVATFSGADTAAVGDVDQAIQQGEKAGVKLIIANLPEGRKLADALAERLGAKVVVFGNFPAVGQGQSSFDELLADNVARLLEAVGQ